MHLEALFGFASGSRITINVVPDSSHWKDTVKELWKCQARAYDDMAPSLIPVLARLRASRSQPRFIIKAPHWIDFFITGDMSEDSYKDGFEKVSFDSSYIRDM